MERCQPVLHQTKLVGAAVLGLCVSAMSLPLTHARAQTVDDGSDAAIGKDDARRVLGLVGTYLDKATDPKVTELRRTKDSIICGSVNVKGKDGRYLGERGFVIDLSIPSFGRVPEGPELLNPRADGFQEKEQIRQQYFAMCLE